jgi:2-dehydro-3-deoxyphosphooctonate aldolase (KDO 8-P synthase)
MPLLLIAGPCVIEAESLCLEIADVLAEIARQLPVQVVFKASYDKANRTSAAAFRGPGIDEGLGRCATCSRCRRSSVGRPICCSPLPRPARR